MLLKQDAANEDEVNKQDAVNVDEVNKQDGDDDNANQLASSSHVGGVKRPFEIDISIESDAESEIAGPVLPSKVCSLITGKRRV
jgi:hypothetical protein